MFFNKTQNIASGVPSSKNMPAQIVAALESMITTFVLVLVLVFIAFIMQTFTIPTGSMANTLLGAHFSLRCPQCGYEYNHDFIPQRYGLPPDKIPRTNLSQPPTCCPNCGYYNAGGAATRVTKGDKILVLKCIYHFFEPKRWDAIVFKNPRNPTQNYIKRLIACPGEKIEIIDGDIYINDRIARKPPKLQNKLWMPVYDNDYQPARSHEGLFNKKNPWKLPLINLDNSMWKIDEHNPTILHLDSPSDQINSLTYDSFIGNDFKATYAYNNIRMHDYMPYCSDLMTRFYVNYTGPNATIGIAMSKYQTVYKALVNLAGSMTIVAVRGNNLAELTRKTIEPPLIGEPISISFANVDHQLTLRFGSEKLTYDLGCAPQDAGNITNDIQPRLTIFGSGKLTLSHIAIFRDIHYTDRQFAANTAPGHAVRGNPFILKENEFFALGDNSPVSADGRWWNKPGKANNARSYRPGIIPCDYLVGKAFFVIWPASFRPSPHFPFSFIPNVGKMRFIYGGSNKSQ